jgi:hypothetical protein
VDAPEDGTGSAGSDSVEPQTDNPQPDEPQAVEPPTAEARSAGMAPAEKPAAGARAASAWQSFRAWRRSRPFWGGLLLLLAGVELVVIPLLSVLARGSVKVVIYIGIGGVFGVLIGGLLMACGLLVWFHPSSGSSTRSPGCCWPSRPLSRPTWAGSSWACCSA